MMDKTDLKIIQKLKEDGRASFSDIAEDLDLATSTVTSRFQKLKEKEIITGFRPVIDYEKLGLGLASMVEVVTKSDMTEETANKLKNHEKVTSFFEVTGKKDMVLITRFKDRSDMNNFVKELQQMEGIYTTETHMILTKPKIEDNMELKNILD